MRVVLNVIWLLLAGIWLAIAYAVLGLICFVLIITIPFGIASWRIAGYALWPFGRTVIRRSDAGIGSAIGNVIWVIVAGIWLAIGHLVTGILLCLTIIGIPLGIADFKMIPISLLPLGREIVPVDDIYPATMSPSSNRGTRRRGSPSHGRTSITSTRTLRWSTAYSSAT